MKPPTTTLLVTREAQETREQTWLSPYATRASASLGRRFPDGEPGTGTCGSDLRTCFQRDKDRIIHSTAFRRLEYKTQVFVNHEGDHYRTRLTHTLEVAQIARSIARALALNEDLAEAVALGHDMGHTPFGHAGERTLHRLTEEHGGFEHNAQALRIVDVIEDRYPGMRGLNLTAEVRRGLLKSKPPYPGEDEGLAPFLPVEAIVSDVADEIAYNSHDCDDGLESGLLRVEALREVQLWREVEDSIRECHPQIHPKKLRAATVRALIDRQVQDVIQETLQRMRACDEGRLDKTELTPSYSPKMEEYNRRLKDCLRVELYSHPRVVAAMDKSTQIMERLFASYLRNTDRLSTAYRQRIPAVGPQRAVADYIAGMTDRYAEALDRTGPDC